MVSDDTTDISISWTSFDILVITSPFRASEKKESCSRNTLSYIFFLISLTTEALKYAILLLARKINPFFNRLAPITITQTSISALNSPFLSIKS